MAPYFRKFQAFVPQSQEIKDFLQIDYIDLKIQGSSASIQSSFPTIKDPIQRAWVDVCKIIHHDMKGNPLSGHSIGDYFSPWAITGDIKERSHAVKGYYGAATSRPNLQLITVAQVWKVDFKPPSSSEDATASGVQFSYTNTKHNIAAVRKLSFQQESFHRHN